MLLTVTFIEVPDEADTLATEPVAEPDTVVTEKSSVETLFAFSSKLTAKVTEVAELAGEPLKVMELTTGGVASVTKTAPENVLGTTLG